MQTHLETRLYDSGKDGPHLLATGAVHGNETAGPIALGRLIEALDSGALTLLQGRLTVIPVCNPEAMRRDVRFVEVNMNRVIKPAAQPVHYEEKLAQALIPHIQACDYMLDIHSTHVPGDPAFSFMDESRPDCVAMARATGIETLFVGWEDVYQGEDHSTEAYANRIGKCALTVECGYHKEPAAAETAWNSLMNVMAWLGMADPATARGAKKDANKTYRFLHAVIREAEGDALLPGWRHLSPVKAGQAICTRADGGIVTADRDGYILIPNYDAAIGAEMYYFGVSAS